MIRLIDIRNQGTGSRFAFWNTNSDSFVTITGEQAWRNTDELKEVAEGLPLLPRLLAHCESHPWTASGEDNIEGWYSDEPPFKHIQEFSLVWFDSAQKWVVVFPDGTVIDKDFGATGYAFNAALELTGRSDCEFTCESSTDSFVKYVKDEDFWRGGAA